jgi:hypothetical protein
MYVWSEAEKLGCAPSSSVRMLNCAKHMEKPVQLAVGRMRGVGAAVLAAARSRTEVWLDKELAKMPPHFREVVGPRLDALCVCRRLTAGLPTDGVITNQPAESMLGTFMGARQHGPVACLLQIHQWGAERYVDSAARSQQRVDALTPHHTAAATEEYERRVKYDIVTWQQCTVDQLAARISKQGGATELVTAMRDQTTGQVTLSCPCLMHEEHGRPCGRLMRLLEEGNMKCAGLKLGRDLWNWQSHFMYAPRLWTATWRAQYSVPLVALEAPVLLTSAGTSMEKLDSLLQAQVVGAPLEPAALAMYPPPYTKPSGRPKKQPKRKEPKQYRRYRSHREKLQQSVVKQRKQVLQARRRR